MGTGYPWGWRGEGGGRWLGARFHHVVQGAFDPGGCGSKWRLLAAQNTRLSTSGCDPSRNVFFAQDFQDAQIQ